jgi:hypothetical protein
MTIRQQVPNNKGCNKINLSSKADAFRVFSEKPYFGGKG